MDYYYSDLAQTMDAFQPMTETQAWGIVAILIVAAVFFYKALKVLLA